VSPRVIRNIIVVTFFYLAFQSFLKAQTNKKFRLENPAIYYGSSPGSVVDNKNYSPQVHLINIPFELGVKKKRIIQKHVILEPQYSRVSTTITGESRHFEYGINTGLRLVSYSRLIEYYFQVSTGPHYISTDFFNSEGDTQQRGGFIFSDNLALGLRKAFGSLNIHTESRFRHLSNANLKQPNAGINNIFIILGVGLNI